MMKKQIVTNVCVFLGTALAFLLCLELGFRSYYNAWSFQNFIGVGQEYDLWMGNFYGTQYPWELNTYLGWIPKPLASLTMPAWENAQVTILEDGIRSNGSPSPLSNQQAPRILAVGDSFTFGDQVADHQTWPALLENLTGGHVFNAGVFGYGVDQSFLRAKLLLAKYHPDILIFSLIPADIFRCEFSISFGVRKPYFTANNAGDLILRDFPLAAQPNPDQGLDAIRTVSGYSFLVHYFMAQLDPIYWYTGRHNLRVDNQGEASIPGGQIACLLMQELAYLSKTTGIRILVLLQYSTSDEQAQMELAIPFLSCLNRDVLYVLDLKPDLQKVQREDSARYNRFFNIHMTPEGNQFVSEQIYAFLLSKNLTVQTP